MDPVIKEAKRKLKKLGFGHIKLRVIRSSEGLRESSGRFTPGYYTQESIVVRSDRPHTSRDRKFCEKKYGVFIHSTLGIDELKALKKVFGKYPIYGDYTMDSDGYYYE